MNIKSRAIGLLSAGILGLSILTGSALAEGTVATFQQNPNGTCSAAASSSTVDFGTYVFNGTSYVATTPPVVNFSVTSTYGPSVGCNVNIQSSALVKTGDSSATVPVADILLNNISGGTQGTVNTPVYIGYNLLVVKNGVGNYTSTIYLNGLYAGAYDVGNYTGTLSFTAVVAAP